MPIYRVYIVSLLTDAVLCRCDFFETAKTRSVYDAINKFISDHPLSTVNELAIGNRILEPNFMVTIGCTSQVRCFIFSQVGSFPLDIIAHRFCFLLQSDPDCKMIIGSSAAEPTKHPCLKRFRKIIYFELINFYYYLIPAIQGDLSRIARQDRDLANEIGLLMDGKRCIGDICQLLTVSRLQSSWLTWRATIEPDDERISNHDQTIKNWCSHLHWKAPIPLIERIGDIVAFLIKYSVSVGASKPVILVKNTPFSFDVFVLQDSVSERQKSIVIEKCSNDLSQPVFPEVVEMVLGKFDGFSTIKEIEQSIPLPSQLVRNISETLVDYRLIERPVVIPRKPAHDWQSLQLGGSADDYRNRTYRLFDGELSLEHIAIFSGVHISQVVKCAKDKAVSVEKIFWASVSRRERLTRIRSPLMKPYAS
eukprot:TRINITY_DN9626_c0_g1_i1.p1 TRINITY_DN9626_c0_g1~~TRINITY_DN9626_c0_g1_i1.p1  ORF type:complete len:421 (+),score=57.47 TRINITY_DN9626_c0_g1_i1:108-1370(+)